MVDVVTKTSDADTIRDKEAVIKNSLARIDAVAVKALNLLASTRVANDSKMPHAQHQFAADKGCGRRHRSIEIDPCAPRQCITEYE